MFITANAALINETTGEYPVSVWRMQRDTQSFSFGEAIDEAILAELGYAVVHPVDPPAGVNVREIAPVKTEGGYTQAYAEYVKTQAELDLEFNAEKSELLSRLENLLQESQSAGVAFNFGTELEPDIQHIQIRDQDPPNLLAIKAFAEFLPEMTQSFRTLENKTNTITSAVAINVAVTGGVGYSELLKKYWTVKDSLIAATTFETLRGISVTLA